MAANVDRRHEIGGREDEERQPGESEAATRPTRRPTRSPTPATRIAIAGETSAWQHGSRIRIAHGLIDCRWSPLRRIVSRREVP
jgi:hypothetical protein